LLVLSVVFFGMGWAAKNYRAHKHNETVNRHRQNALRTFETFAAATEDKTTKDAVLLQTTKAIFEPQTSGYLTGEAEKVPSGAVVEVLKNVMSSRDSS
jgi:DNA phosphorothioation-dependent restriction protein DptG